MSKYFFNLRVGDDLVRDHLGIDLPSDEDAFEEAVRTWHDLLAAADGVGEKRDSTIEITESDGTVIATVPFGYAERLKGK